VSQTNGGWEPVSKEPAEEPKQKTMEKPTGHQVPVALTATLDLDPKKEIVAALKELTASQIACAAEMTAALKEHAVQMAGWMKQLETVLMAPRKVTMTRDKDGLAKQAVSEIVGVRDKRIMN